jgi:predicted transcriptional regulator
MKTVKDEVLETLDRLPPDATMDAVVYDLYFKAKVMRGIEQAERGETIPNSEVMEELEEWLRSIGQ